jgi:CDGSH-type Zn-finger protein
VAVAERVIAGKGSIKLEMGPGTYWWCQCGRSAKQPFCDGSHMGTGLSPLKVQLAEKSSISWCACKHTHTSPRCDGTHKTLP